MPSLTSAPTVNRRTAVRLGSGGLAAALAGCRMHSTEAQELAPLEANKALVSRVFEETVVDMVKRARGGSASGGRRPACAGPS